MSLIYGQADEERGCRIFSGCLSVVPHRKPMSKPRVTDGTKQMARVDRTSG
ncbi:MAG: hypothetical protein UC944_08525 [Anaerovibrio sp.]|nr:hypothetical protein [Anaerovibrio sp.]